MLKNKSDKKSEKYKAQANDKYANGDFLDALKLYNKALCYAESDEKLSLIYGNRSAVYYEVRRLKECLENIELAKRHGFPSEKIQRLNEREEKCKNNHELLELLEERDQNVENFLQLSHPANPKVPFLVECLEVRQTKQFGRGIYATSDLAMGDIIAIEKPLFIKIDSRGLNVCCINCFEVNMLNLIPCLKTASFMFCSEACRDEAYEKFPQLEALYPSLLENGVVTQRCYERMVWELNSAFGGLDNLMDLLKTNDLQKSKKTIFDFDFTDHAEYDKNLILASLSLGTEIRNKNIQTALSNYSKLLSGRKPLLEKFLLHLMSVHDKNNTGTVSKIGGQQVGGLYVFTSMINHSCWPNVQFSYVGNKLVVYISKEVKAGKQLFFNYIHNGVDQPREIRHALINASHYFTCGCYLCKNKRTPLTLKSKKNQTLELLCNSMKASVVLFNQCKKGDCGGMGLHLLQETIGTARNQKNLLANNSKESYEFQSVFVNFFDTMCWLLQTPALT